MTPQRAVILAAGQGVRLRSVVDDRPKGLIEIDGEPLVGRSIRLLRDAGIARVTIVAGYRAGQYRQFAAGERDLTIVMNEGYATGGSMASLAAALDAAPLEDVLVLESDIIYEPRALTAILEAPFDNVTLVSGPTGAGDEVWVDASGGRLRTMSKERATLSAVVGEFVGITRVSSHAAAAMRRQCRAPMDYETGGLVAIARHIDVQTIIVPDLQWGEIDDERQYARVVSMDWRS
jgi:choline kinase